MKKTVSLVICTIILFAFIPRVEAGFRPMSLNPEIETFGFRPM